MPAAEPVLAIQGLNAYYGASHVLQDVECTLESGAVAIVGRNGMGKSTLCNAIMGLIPRTSGSIRFFGSELVGKAPHDVANAGIGYVPQGRRLFPSLTTDEHLRMIRPRRGRWTVNGIYELFPQLAHRRRVGAGQLSGGEKQMLAIGRALLCNPRLLIMDEPSEGLAPAIVQTMVQTLHTLAGERMHLLVVEQNLGVAAALAQRLLIMLRGHIATETTAAALAADVEAQRRYLGVGSTTLPR
ncbi:MAG TPA: ABC transporter ATP-binding protein [Candidatus Limnocylindrales bacterium]|nr:ABC transporter ATP-binding protein [Candidatus Limnocylindrales bacterium]